MKTFGELAEYLEGPAGCNFREKDGETVWDCGDNTKDGDRHAMLKAACEKHGIALVWEEGSAWPLIAGEEIPAGCDCEVVFNMPESLVDQPLT